MPTVTLTGREADLADRVRLALGDPARLGVAFSGGVDSAVLLALAARSLGAERVVAILGVSESLAASERTLAHDVAGAIGVQLVEVRTRELASPAYRANGPDRCFHCKSELFTRISDEVAGQHGLTAIAYGENADDVLRIDRPGSRAASNHRVLRPLADAGLTKADVRAVARGLRLAVADKPAAPCLASRIPHAIEVTAPKLRQIERAEEAVRALGFVEFRVRHHGVMARLEVASEELPRAVELRDELVAGVSAAGFESVTIDPAGLQSGAFTTAALRG